MTHHCKPSVSKQWKRQTVIRAQISLFMSTFEQLWNTQPSFHCSSKVYCLWTAHTDLHVVRPDVLVFKTGYQDTATDYQIWFCSKDWGNIEASVHEKHNEMVSVRLSVGQSVLSRCISGNTQEFEVSSLLVCYYVSFHPCLQIFSKDHNSFISRSSSPRLRCWVTSLRLLPFLHKSP